MSYFDNQYRDLVNHIAKHGQWSDENVRTKYADGTPAKYKSIIGYQMRINNFGTMIPLLTSRYTPWKSATREIYWIWLMQSNNVDELNKLGCKFWDEWKLEDGTIGNAYGYQMAKETFGHKSQLHYIIHELKNNPNSRRIMTEIWVPEELDKMALTPCVHLTQWSVIDGKLYLEVRQRSCDVAIGLISNVYQYALLHKLVAMECGLEPADIIWNIHNAHIYDRHYDLLINQVFNNKTFYTPHIEINNFTSIFNFKPEDVNIVNYSYDETKYNYEIAI